MTAPIDFVMIWVDGNDPAWQKEFMKYQDDAGDRREHRFRDMDLMRYWFRGVEQFAPWVNKVYFVTCGQRPAWLNTAHPKLVCVDHKDFIPAQYLPTFSSHAIEVNLHRIPGLSEQFVYFNDDTFLGAPTAPELFFRDGLPCDSMVINYFAPRTEPLNLVPFINASVINRHFVKKDVMRAQASKLFTLKYHKYLLKNIQFIMGKWFPGFKHFHLPASFLKQTFEAVWAAEPEILERTTSHRNRVLTDVNQWLFSNWQFCTGQFSPRDVRTGFFGSITDEASLADTVRAIDSGRYPLICANDEGIEDFDLMKRDLKAAFERLLPEPSSFELPEE